MSAVVAIAHEESRDGEIDEQIGNRARGVLYFQRAAEGIEKIRFVVPVKAPVRCRCEPISRERRMGTAPGCVRPVLRRGTTEKGTRRPDRPGRRGERPLGMTSESRRPKLDDRAARGHELGEVLGHGLANLRLLASVDAPADGACVALER